ncbi:hypothetical protein [uncultured Alistipes sp.]|uniref:hypothetical protein n=1 Tax=uncultured Alistipes sp. TaxID=538949 RepID=UPI002609E5C9|nr:hypothetical protein [uncultured Alistipes sp.]
MRLAVPPLCLALTAAAPCRAQRTLPDPVAAVPEYLYCEIIAEADHGVARSGVVFDFGQRTEAWRYDYLSDAEGKALRTKHYLLRLPLRPHRCARRPRPRIFLPPTPPRHRICTPHLQ